MALFRKKRSISGSLAAIVTLSLMLWGGWQLFVRQHHLSFVPDAMGVSRILYISEKMWGFGPGGNETGIIVYEMPEQVARGLKARGHDYLNDLAKNTGKDWHGKYWDWHETPTIMHRRWPRRQVDDFHVSWTTPGIGDYLYKYLYIIPLDENVEQMVNRAILNDGSYYAFGRIGMIIVSPEERRIVFAYNG